MSLLSTVPGFTPPTNNHSVGTNPSRALYFAANGGDHYQNNTRIDGASTQNMWLPDIVAIVPTHIPDRNSPFKPPDTVSGLGSNVLQVPSKTDHARAAGRCTTMSGRRRPWEAAMLYSSVKSQCVDMPASSTRRRSCT